MASRATVRRLAAVALLGAALVAALAAPGGAFAEETAAAKRAEPHLGPGPKWGSARHDGGPAGLDARVAALAEQLRCLVCQNQTIADSSAQLALDLKAEVRRQLAAGKADGEVIAFMTQRYGDFVLYKPPVKATTWLLWFGPFALLAAGLLVLLRALRRQASAPPGDFEEEIEA
ncbi:cytochrome c-type biogenesis protein [Pseudoduganella namucuonensis]|uniref:Cytochrome c-type biogenesis protein n=1 Tax=Pseudoduganella namucuonensis TaxID=1035707 RepID=A0A1I7M6C3_9BURK|nr:cytochrome c-type biogenesis protein [Pseudoduganella namucuonensis]SFV17437.1 Cytochrome c-type biogenesis protein CcmH/NrfF [Pseudoduganella namucuonensis]